MQFTPHQKYAAAWTGLVAVLAWALWSLASVLTPFVVAAVLAYALTPVVNRLHGLTGSRLPRLLAVVLVELLLILVVLGVMFLIVPVLSKELPLMREQVPLLLERINNGLQPVLASMGLNFSFDIASIKAFMLTYLNSNFEETFSSLLSSLKIGGSLALTLIGNAVLIPVALFYLLKDWQQLVARTQVLVPPSLRQAYDQFMREADDVLGQYLHGQLLVMLLLAVFYSIGLFLFGLDLALPIGVFTGLAIFVPYLGFGLGLLLATLASLLQFAASTGPGSALLVVAVVYGAGQLLESFILTPRLVGERIGLHPLAVIFALLAFGQLLGFVGVLLALPASAVLLVAMRRAYQRYLNSSLYRS
ncbi:MAG: AI-2E family transporter [Burkholderiaceae bacterium]